MQKILFISLLLLSFGAIGNESSYRSLEQIASESKDSITIKRIHNQTIVDYTLDPKCSENMNEFLKEEKNDPYKNWEYYRITAREILEKILPSDLLEIIQKMKTENCPTALYVHNMPIDNYIPETPQNGNRPPCIDSQAKGFVSEITLLGLCSLLDSFPDFDEREKDGTYINQIIPRDDESSKNVASSFGSEVPFYAHTENVYSYIPLKFFALLGLRGDPKVNTSIIFLDKIIEFIKKDKLEDSSYIIEMMHKSDYLMKTGPSFERGGQITTRLPILSVNAEGERIYRFNANSDRVEGITPEAKEIVNYLKYVLTCEEFQKNYKTSFNIQKGDLLLFNNWEIMHARDGFKIDKENWRWLQRCYFMQYKDIQN